MPVSFGSPIDLQKLELQNPVIHSLATAPSSPVEGQVYYNTADDNLYVYDGTNWIDLTSQGVTYTAGTGLTLSGTSFSVNYGTTSGTATQGNDGRLPTTDEKAALAGTSGAPSTTNKYVTNGDSRLTDSRAPSGSAGGDLSGTYPNPTVANSAITDAKVASNAGIQTSKIANFDTAVRASRLDQMAAPTADVSLNSRKITSLADGTAAGDAVNKGQLDAAQNGLDVKASVRVASTANVATISGLLTIDGVTLVAGNRVLLKDQTTKAQNGIWVVASGSWTRATDADAAGELSGGSFVFVEEGTANADTGWVITTNGSITPGTTAHDWAIFSRAGELVAGDGITKTGATLAVDSTVARRNAANTFTGQVEASHATNPAFKVATGHGSGAAFDANGEGKIIGVVDPTNAQDAATKGYVDAQTGGGQYAADIGNGSATTITVTHSLGSRDVIVQVYRNSGNYDEVIVETRRTTTNAVDLVFATAPTTNQYRVVVRK